MPHHHELRLPTAQSPWRPCEEPCPESKMVLNRNATLCGTGYQPVGTLPRHGLVAFSRCGDSTMSGPVIDYANPWNRPNRRRAWRTILPWAALGSVLVLLVGSMLLPGLNHSRPHSPRLRCASNLRQIGQGILLYANDNHGKFPSRLDQLITDADIPPEILTCPSSNDQKATGATTQQILADFAKPG